MVNELHLDIVWYLTDTFPLNFDFKVGTNTRSNVDVKQYDEQDEIEVLEMENLRNCFDEQYLDFS